VGQGAETDGPLVKGLERFQRQKDKREDSRMITILCILVAIAAIKIILS
jgi:hypothetical protein